MYIQHITVFPDVINQSIITDWFIELTHEGTKKLIQSSTLDLERDLKFD